MNRKLIAVGLSGLVLAGIAATQSHFISRRTANDELERVSPAPRTAANATSDQVVHVDQGVTHQLARPEPRSVGNAPENAGALQDPPAQTRRTEEHRVSRHEERADASDPGIRNADDRDPRAVIGRPFLISASVKEECRRYDDEVCEGLYRTLARMTMEPRDPLWAPEMESVLRKRVEAAAPVGLLVRNIECRQSVCAFEVQALEVYKAGGDLIELERTHGIFLDQYTLGHEYTEDGTRITVTTATFIRK